MTNEMSLSPEGLDFLKRHEGSVKSSKGTHEMYFDVAAFRTIGYGHKLSPSEVYSGKITILDQHGIRTVIKYGNGITDDQALMILNKDVADTVRAVNIMIRIPLKQHEFDALVSFVYNIGTNAFSNSTIRKIINTAPETNPDDYARAVEAQFKRWNRAGGREVPGLVTRRAHEARLFNLGKYTTG